MCSANQKQNEPFGERADLGFAWVNTASTRGTECGNILLRDLLWGMAADSVAVSIARAEMQLSRQRLGHSGNSVTDNYTHTFTADERNAAEKLGELFGTGWPEIDAGKVISFPNLSQKEDGLAGGVQQALVNQ